jgi:hypothetical protein
MIFDAIIAVWFLGGARSPDAWSAPHGGIDARGASQWRARPVA